MVARAALQVLRSRRLTFGNAPSRVFCRCTGSKQAATNLQVQKEKLQALKDYEKGLSDGTISQEDVDGGDKMGIVFLGGMFGICLCSIGYVGYTLYETNYGRSKCNSGEATGSGS
eukprot:TRINITY_DN106169_c0_g1_i1.p1 TRINITY_DN106169_c0_g1~~TRINITY_DN106169_c0_g1_i1.p1  ORF type:complete len:115 (-),score=7.46 TRINITY_DN106169_c0_g1_i1:503-847(-)